MQWCRTDVDEQVERHVLVVELHHLADLKAGRDGLCGVRDRDSMHRRTVPMSPKMPYTCALVSVGVGCVWNEYVSLQPALASPTR